MAHGQSLHAYTWEEIKKHNNAESLWLVIGRKIYDVTKFRTDHPGGEEVLLENAGTDATAAFQDVGHSMDAIKTREKYLLGVVRPESSTTPKPIPQTQCSGIRCDKAGLTKAALVICAVGVAVALVMAYKKYK